MTLDDLIEVDYKEQETKFVENDLDFKNREKIKKIFGIKEKDNK